MKKQTNNNQCEWHIQLDIGCKLTINWSTIISINASNSDVETRVAVLDTGPQF